MSTKIAIPAHPTLYQIFTRVWLDELSREAGKPITLANVPDAVLDRLAALGFDYIYLMGVWTLGEEGPRISRTHAPFRGEYDRSLPGWTEADIVGSPFAIARYAVSSALGGDAGLARLRERLAQRGIGVILDFVPNHLARDHHWITERPECFIRDENGIPVCGQDPYFPPWPDTAQLDLRLDATRAALIETLHDIGNRCDGVRCDMAMLVLDDVFRRTWSHRPAAAAAPAFGEFWAQAIDAVRAQRPGFLFIAEAYWNLEWRLQMIGFDFTYDKSLYDRLCHGTGPAVVAHLDAAPDYQRRSVRFVENHDEARVAAALPLDRRKAAIVIAATAPGMRFFHHGQLEGKTLRTSAHLARAGVEPVDPECQRFHEIVLGALRRPALRSGSFARLRPQNASTDGFVAYRWDPPRREEIPMLIVVNFSPARGGCRIPLDIAGLGGRTVVLADLLSGEMYQREGDALLDPSRGLYVELPGYGVHLFAVNR